MKISVLKNLELNHLRERIQAKYIPVHHSVFSGDFVPNAYKPNYANLAKEIDNLLKQKFGAHADYHDKAYVSTGLLRKLFHESKDKEQDTFSAAFIDACYWYITDGNMDRMVYLKSQLLAEKSQKEPRVYVKIIALAGALAGCITSIITLSLYTFNGFDGIPPRELYPLIFFVQVAIGWMIGWLCGNFVVNYADKNNWGNKVYLFISSFVGFAIMRQIASRDALLLPGEGQYGGGPLGEPDMETVAAAFSCAWGLVSCATFLGKVKIPSFQMSLLESAKIALIAGISFASVYLVYRVLLNSGLVEYEAYLISPAVFSFEFPSPERIYLTFMIAGIYTFIIFSFLRLTYKP